MPNVYIRRMPDALIRVAEGRIDPYCWSIAYDSSVYVGGGAHDLATAQRNAMNEYSKHTKYTGEYPDWEVL